MVAEQGFPQVLRISQLDVEHQNHPTTKGYAKLLPRRRRLNDTERKLAASMVVDGKGKVAAVANYMRKTTGKAVTSRDLSNIK